MHKSAIPALCALLVTAAMVLSGFSMIQPRDAESPQVAEAQAADPPHEIIHFLHTGETGRYISPELSVLSFFDTDLPFNMTGDGRSFSGQEQFAMQWYMFPPAASNLTVSCIDTILWITGEVGTGQPNFAGSIEIFEVTQQDIEDLDFNGTSVYLYNIASDTPLFTYPPSAPMVFPLVFTHTFSASSTIRFVLTVNPGASGAGVGSQYTNVTVFWDSCHRFDSRLLVQTQNPLTIDDCGTKDHDGGVTNGFVDEGNTTMSFFANISDPYGGYDVRWVNITVRDPNGTALAGLDDIPMVRVAGSDMSAVSQYELRWNYTETPVGVYSYEIWAVDNSGMTTFYYFSQLAFEPFDELAIGSFAIGIIHNLAVHLNDSMDEPLVGALVTYDGAPSAVSNDTGWANMIVFGNGTLSVYWRDVLVNTSEVNVTGDQVVYADCSVFYPELIVVDSLGASLPSAAVFFEYPDGEALPVRVSDNIGSVGVISQVPIGESALNVWWRGSLVYDGAANVSENGALAVRCDVFYMTVHVVDSEHTPIPMSTVAWLSSDTQILIDSTFANTSGASVSRLPAGTYDVDIYWHGNLIASESEIVVADNMHITIVGQVCSVNILALDTKGLALEEAHIVVRSATDVIVSQMTNDSGAIHVVLPIGTLEIDTYWHGNLVNSTEVTLTGDANIVVKCAVSYLEIFTNDSGGDPLDGVEVVLKDAQGETIGYGATVNGRTGFRLPDQTVTVEAHYATEFMMTHVSLTQTTSVQVTGEKQATLVFDYPPGVLSTVVFSLAMIGALAAAFAVMSVLLFLKLQKKGGVKNHAWASKDQKTESEEQPLPPPED